MASISGPALARLHGPVTFARLSGAAGIGFVVVLIVANVVLTAAGFPTPSDTVDAGEVAAVFAAERGALRLASALLPTAWLLATLFAAGMVARSPTRTWSIVGAAGIVMQSAVFTGVEASRLALSVAAVQDPGAVAGLWGLHNALFSFNQVFLATALLGFSFSEPGRPARAVGLTGAVLLFASATAGPYGVDDVNPLALCGLAGWLLWLVWIGIASARLLRTPQPAG